MAEKRKVEFFLLRYVPDAVKGEYVNFGLVMIESPKAGFADVRLTTDWRHLLCLDPQADIEMLRAMERDIRRQVVDVRDCESVMRWLNDSFSNLVQLSESKGCLTTDPAKEIEVMAGMYLASAQAGQTRALSAREQIVLTIQESWESAGVASLVKRFPVERYTGKGDSFAFDFGYLVGNQLKLFHAVSLKARIDPAVTLAARYPKIANLIRNAEKDAFEPTLTAVVDNDLDEKKLEIGFALAMMREANIRVAEVREMPGIAEEARRELRV